MFVSFVILLFVDTSSFGYCLIDLHC